MLAFVLGTKCSCFHSLQIICGLSSRVKHFFHVSFASHDDMSSSLCSENGFEEGISTLGLVSGLVSAMWSVG